MNLESTQLKIGNFFSRNHVLLTGNATTALYLILRSLDLPKGSQIMIPNSSCPHVPVSIYLAKHKPLFVDIDKNTYGLNFGNLNKNFNKKVKAVIAVHAYGQICDIKKISKFCKNKNVPLIEDAALALGLKIKNRYVGSFGNASVLSFGKGKVLDAGGGGAILLNDSRLYKKIKKNNDKLNVKKKINEININKFNNSHTKLYNKYFLTNKKSKLKKFFKKNFLKRAQYFLHKFEAKNIKKINFDKKKLENIKKKRFKNIILLKKKLNKPSLNFFNITKTNFTGIPWRFNVVFFKEGHRNFVLKKILKENIKISSWHPSLDIFFQNRTKKNNNYPISDNLSNHILNIWINEEVNKNYIEKICNKIYFCKKILFSQNLK